MLVRRLVLVAVVFLLTTVVLFAHLQTLGTEDDNLEHHEENFIEDSKAAEPSKTMEPPKPTVATNVQEHVLINTTKSTSPPAESLDDVHVFYYPWYASEKIDGKWNHWDHHILPHWNDQTKAQYKHGVQYEPPDDIGANFYPLRGPYSSKDPKIIDEHMADLSGYVVVISWWGTSGSDGEGSPTNAVVPDILKSAEKYGAYIAIHLEPYNGRNALTVKNDIEYIYKHYGSSPALYRSPKHNNRIVLYVYDSYHTPATEWATVFSPSGEHSIRGTKYDAVALGLYRSVNDGDADAMINSHFDGFYTYFAANGFTEGSTYTNWERLSSWAKENNLLFCLSVGPGYDDTRIRPWNAANKKSRNNGQYYETQWEAAMKAKPGIISITSYNEWHEGTQIEASIPKRIEKTIYDGKSYEYEDFSPLEPDYYMTKTHEWAVKFARAKAETPS